MPRRAAASAPLSGRPIPRSFYDRPVLTVARACIGKVLVRRTAEGVVAGRIVEAEAYRGPEDRAAHSHGGRRTPRNETMWGPPGHAYVFFVYGMHHHVNLVTGAAGRPQAVLVRALEPVAGHALMAERRGMDAARRELTAGPGRLCVALSIDRGDDGTDLCGPDLYLLDGPRGHVATAPRVGIDYAEAWADKPWRFYEVDNPWVSVRPRGSIRRRA